MFELDKTQQQIVDSIRQLVQREVIPVASELEQKDEYPHAMVERLKEFGLFGANVPEEYGGLGLDTTTYAIIIEEHQTIQIMLAEMGTKIEASKLLVYSAAEKKDRGERCDLEAGMAKLFATETAQEASLQAMRIHGGAGYSKDFRVERYYRDAPLLIIGGGTSELQRLIIAKGLLAKYPVQ